MKGPSSSMAVVALLLAVVMHGAITNSNAEQTRIGGRFLTAGGSPQSVFDVTKYGAVCDGKTDLAPALTKAWCDACASPCPSKVVVPRGDYFCGVAKLNGPCKAPIELEINGNLMAPEKIKGEDWLVVEDVDNVKVFGTGSLDGRGGHCWENKGDRAPNMRFQNINNGWVEGLTSKDSKFFHFSTLYVKNMTLTKLNVIAPAESRNTDGVHVSRSSCITVSDSTIATGDDCVSMADGLDTITVRNVKCGPSHGISIGSLGKYDTETPLKSITVHNCTIANSDNGIRIKSWPDRFATSLTDVHFEDICFDDVENPIIIDQEYCPHNECKSKKPSLVQISDVFFKNVRGTSRSEEIINLICSATHPCKNVEMCDVDISYKGGAGKAVCENVKPVISGIMNPKGC